ncbi:hypothetical protein [Streptomyces sp. NPDC056524]|uniref:hypothetical protein n=1 Tax=Streptomyces sp. NPDC056524 TaxID=3345851 RepID=UPI00368FE0D8
MATPERERAEARIPRISMSELLASCAAANVVSTPPRESDSPENVRPENVRPENVRPDTVERDIEREAA